MDCMTNFDDYQSFFSSPLWQSVLKQIKFCLFALFYDCGIISMVFIKNSDFIQQQLLRRMYDE